MAKFFSFSNSPKVQLFYLNWHTSFSILTFLFFAPSVADAAKITAEKNCVVRIDSGDFSIGENVFVVKEPEGGATKGKKVAIVVISKIAEGKAIGKVTKGPKTCTALKGLSIEKSNRSLSSSKPSRPENNGTLAENQESSGSKTKLPKVQFQLAIGGQFFNSVGAHVDQNTKVPAIQMTAFQGKASLFPLMFFGNTQKPSFISQLLGISFSYDGATTIPNVAVSDDGSTPAAGSTEPAVAASGKQSSNVTDIHFALIGRIPYLQNKLNSQIHLGYGLHSVTHKLVSAEGLLRTPLKNYSANGMYFGLRQEINLIPMLQLGIDGKYFLGTKAKIDLVSVNTADKSLSQIDATETSKALAVGFDALGTFKIFQAGGGFQYQSIGATYSNLEGAASTYSESQMKFLLLLGIIL